MTTNQESYRENNFDKLSSGLNYPEIPEPLQLTIVSYCLSGKELSQKPRNRVKALLREHRLKEERMSLFVGMLTHAEVASLVAKLADLFTELDRLLPEVSCNVRFGSDESAYKFSSKTNEAAHGPALQ